MTILGRAMSDDDPKSSMPSPTRRKFLLTYGSGVATDHLLTMKIGLADAGYDEPQRRSELARQIVEKIENVPGIVSATVANLVPLAGGNMVASITPEGRPFNPNEQLVVSYRIVNSGYFETLKIPTLKGRVFSDRDTANSQFVALISQRTARRYWPGEDPVGRLVRTRRGGVESPWITIVGIVGDVKETTPSRRDTQEIIYVPLAQDMSGQRTGPATSIELAVRTSVEPMSAFPSLKNAVSQVDRRLPVYDIETADQLYATALSQTRIATAMIISFSGFGLLLAALGTYGLFSFRVTCRTRELGIRTALGAKSSDILWLVLRRGAALALIGISLGIFGAVILTRFMAGVLSEIRPGDPLTLAIVAFLLMAVALLACYIPARRATRVDPLVALRYE